MAQREKGLVPQELPRSQGVEWLGDISLMQWAAVLGAAAVVVSPDTGAVHIAAARRRPVVTLHLAKHYHRCSQQWYPWGVPHAMVIKRDPSTTIQELVSQVRRLDSTP
jgi:ADP-heptose:LPS heptosyltransferase